MSSIRISNMRGLKLKIGKRQRMSSRRFSYAHAMFGKSIRGSHKQGDKCWNCGSPWEMKRYFGKGRPTTIFRQWVCPECGVSGVGSRLHDKNIVALQKVQAAKRKYKFKKQGVKKSKPRRCRFTTDQWIKECDRKDRTRYKSPPDW